MAAMAHDTKEHLTQLILILSATVVFPMVGIWNIWTVMGGLFFHNWFSFFQDTV